MLEYLCTELYAAYENQTASEPQADMESSYIDHSVCFSRDKDEIISGCYDS